MTQPNPRTLELLDSTPITLDHQSAHLLGRNTEFPTVVMKDRALSVPFSWSAVHHILENGGQGITRKQ